MMVVNILIRYNDLILLFKKRHKNIEMGVSNELLDKNQKANRAIIRRPQERPSSPSVILKKLAKPVIIMVEMGMKNQPKWIAPKNGR